MAHGHAKLPPYRPQLALLSKAPPEGDDWLHELKLDGFRIGVAIDHGRVHAAEPPRQGLDRGVATVVAGAKKLPVKSALHRRRARGRPARRAHQHARDGRRRDDRLLRVRHHSPRRRGPDGAAAASSASSTCGARWARSRRRRFVTSTTSSAAAPRSSRRRADEDRRHRLEAARRRRTSRAPATRPGRRSSASLRQEFVIGGYERSVLGRPRRALARHLRRDGQLAVRGQGRHRFPARGGRAAEGARALERADVAVRADRAAERRQDPRRALGRARRWCARSRSWSGPATGTSATARSRACAPTRIRARSCARFRSERAPSGGAGGRARERRASAERGPGSAPARPRTCRGTAPSRSGA